MKKNYCLTATLASILFSGIAQATPCDSKIWELAQNEAEANGLKCSEGELTPSDKLETRKATGTGTLTCLTGFVSFKYSYSIGGSTGGTSSVICAKTAKVFSLE